MNTGSRRITEILKEYSLISHQNMHVWSNCLSYPFLCEENALEPCKPITWGIYIFISMYTCTFAE
jgi:hypothetical protein